KRACVRSAMMRASVVLPVPGGPHRMMDWSKSRSIASRSGLPGASRSSWPTNSSNVRGRTRSASGARTVFFGGTSSGNRESTSGFRLRMSTFSALPARFVQDDGGRGRRVERFDGWRHRNREAFVGVLDDVGRKAGPLAADQNDDAALEIR